MADSAGRLLEQNDLILNLNEPCALTDTAWMLLAPATAGRAQTSSSSAPAAPGAPVGVHLVQQSSWVPTGGKFVMFLHVDDPELAAAPGAAIAIRVYRSMTTRTAFDQAVSNNELSGILDGYTP